MTSRFIYFAILAVILFVNIIFAKYIVHQFYYQNYGTTLIFVGLNIALFPVALFIYKKDKRNEDVKKI